MSTPKRAIVLRELLPLVPPAHGAVPGVLGGSRTKESKMVERRKAPELEKVAELRAVLLAGAEAGEAGEAAGELNRLVKPLCCLPGASEPGADEPERSYGWISSAWVGFVKRSNAWISFAWVGFVKRSCAWVDESDSSKSRSESRRDSCR
jgi:hypothetical protein